MVWVVYHDGQGVERFGRFVRADARRIERIVQKVESVKRRDGRMEPVAAYGVRRAYKGTVTVQNHVGRHVRIPQAWVKYVLYRRKRIPLRDFLEARR